MMKELAEALIALQANLPAIVKSETAEVPTKNGGSYKYSYADLASLSEQLLPLLAEHQLAFGCCPTLRDDGQFVLRYQLLHASGEALAGDYPLPLQGGAQAQGSAITYARRYVLCSVTGVAPEDDDGRAAQRASEQPAPAPEPVNLEPLEQLIVTAQDEGLEAEWEKTRRYASQSQGHADHAVKLLHDKLQAHREDT